MPRILVLALAACLGPCLVACGSSLEYSRSGATATAVAGLSVQYHTYSGPSSNQLSPLISVVNGGAAPVALSTLTLRYWYTKDGTQPQSYWCDYTPRGCSNVTQRFVSMTAPVATADTYLELGFTAGAGTLAPGSSTGDLQVRVAKSDWSNFAQSNDWSYDGTKSSTPASWDRVTLYDGGVLIWGTEPGGPAPADTQPPTAPASLTSTGVTATSVSLSWTASTDNVGVTGYDVYSGATRVATSATTSATVSGLSASTVYGFTVRARDAAGNTSSPSSALAVTTGTTADTRPPTAPASLTSTGVTSSSVSLAWAVSTDDVGVTAYYVDSGSARVTSTSTSATVSGLSPSTTYTFTVRARDAAGNVSSPSNAVTVTTRAASDTQPPTAPGSLTSTGVTSSSVSLAWSASTDDVGVAGYDVYAGSTRVTSSTATSATVSGLAANTAYTFTVRARDAAGNASSPSNGVTVTTQGASQFELLWQDDFNSFDSSRWQLMTHTWDGNLATFSTANTRFQNGILSLLLTREPSDTAKPFRGVEMRSRDTLTYGKIETRARYARGSGVVSGTVLIYTPWPPDNWNELDIEYLGAFADRVQFNTMVWMGGQPVSPTQYPQTVSLGFDAAADFHVYGIEWTPAIVRFTVDGAVKATWSSEIARMTLPQNILLTIWASNSPGWAGPILSSTAPTQADFDWIRVYRYRQ